MVIIKYEEGPDATDVLNISEFFKLQLGLNIQIFLYFPTKMTRCLKL